MQIGVVYPQTELRGDPAAVRRIGRAVEDLGFDHLLAYDHVLGAVHADRARQLTGPYTEHDPFHDPFVMFAYLAGITERINFATGVMVLPHARRRSWRDRLPMLSSCPVVDCASAWGRWNHVEYEALGQDFHTRGARQEEQILVLRRLFTEPVVDFSGRFHRLDRALSCRSRRGRSRSGLVDHRRRRSTEPLVSRTASSSSVEESTTQSTSGHGCARECVTSEGRPTTLGLTGWPYLTVAYAMLWPMSKLGVRQVVPISRWSAWGSDWTP